MTTSSIQPLILRKGFEIEDPLSVVLGFLDERWLQRELRLQNSRVLAAASLRSEPPAGGGALAARTYGWTGICGPHATVFETENCGNEGPTNPACGRNRV